MVPVYLKSRDLTSVSRGGGEVQAASRPTPRAVSASRAQGMTQGDSGSISCGPGSFSQGKFQGIQLLLTCDQRQIQVGKPQYWNVHVKPWSQTRSGG